MSYRAAYLSSFYCFAVADRRTAQNLQIAIPNSPTRSRNCRRRTKKSLPIAVDSRRRTRLSARRRRSCCWPCRLQNSGWLRCGPTRTVWSRHVLIWSDSWKLPWRKEKLLHRPAVKHQQVLNCGQCNQNSTRLDATSWLCFLCRHDVTYRACSNTVDEEAIVIACTGLVFVL